MKSLSREKVILLVFTCLLFLPVKGFADDLPRHSPVPGGVAVLDLKQKNIKAAFYKKRRVMLKKQNGKVFAIIGLPLSSKPGKHKLVVKSKNRSYKVAFTIKAKKYKTQRLTIKNKRQVNPNAEDMKRIRKERKYITGALTHWQDNPYPETRFIQPVKGIFTSPFGLRRFFNGQPRRPHSGLDIAAPEGTPVKAPADGEIIESGNYFFNGNTVFIDHGQNLVTMYNHLSKIIKPVGSHVKQGEIFALVGKTGRVTGPHLHWSVSLNNTRVEPLLFFTPENSAKPAKPE